MITGYRSLLRFATKGDLRRVKAGIAWHGLAAAFEFVPIALIAILLVEISNGASTLYSAHVALALFAVLSFAMIVRFFCLNLANARCYRAGFDIGTSLRLRIIDHLKSLPSHAVQGIGSSGLAMLLTNQINHVEHILAHGAGQFIASLGFLLLCLAVLLYLNAGLASLAIGSLCVTFLLFIWVASRLKMLARGRSDVLTEANRTFADILLGLPVLRAFGRAGDDAVKKIDASILAIAELYKTAMRRVAPLILGSLLLSDVGLIIIFAVIAWIVGQQADFSSPRPDLAAFLAVMLATQAAIVRLQKLLVALRAADDGVQRIEDFLALPSLARSRPEALPCGRDIELQNVSVTYPGAAAPALDDISMSIPERSVVAIVGPSGAGKTTLIQLICRCLDPSKGSVRIGGADIRAIPLQASPAVSAVLQDMILFDVSVAANIGMGRSEASRSDIEVAAEGALAAAFINELADGYDSRIGENGSQLSGGERARIAIARAILKHADILILDEATAALDAIAERELRTTIETLALRSTVIVVTHRLQTAQWADQVVVIDGGRLRDIGTHRELLLRDTLYQRLWRNQEQALEWTLTGVRADNIGDKRETSGQI